MTSIGLDALAVIAVAALVVGVEPFDGGRELWGQRLLVAAALMAVPIIAMELRRLPRHWTWLVVAWSLAPLLVLGLAVHRTHWVAPTLMMTIVPVTTFSVARLWRRSWGSRAVAALVVVGAALYWTDTFQVWLVTAGASARPQWLALSWHNQSAALMGGLGVALFGWAVRSTPLLRIVTGVVSAACLAVVPLAGSRSVVPLTAAVFVVLVAVLLLLDQEPPSRRTVVLTTIGVMSVAVAIHLSLAGLQQEGTSVPAVQRGTDVTSSANARVDHLDAAVGMFIASPLDGHGFGSYGDLVPDHAEPGDAQSDSVHNEYAEVLAEGGLLAAIPFLALLGALGWAGLQALRGARDPSPGTGGVSLLAAAGLVAVHTAWDFDWKYPVLVALIGLGGGVALSTVPDRARDSGRWARSGAAVFALLVVVAATGLWWQHLPVDAPWEDGALAQRAAELRREGDGERAAAVIEQGLDWNPVSPDLALEHARLLLEGGGGAEEAVAALGQEPRYEAVRLALASDLAVVGEVAAAAALVEEARVDSAGTALLVEAARARIAAITGGCSAMRTSLAGAAGRVERVATGQERRFAGLPARIEALGDQLEAVYCEE